MSEFENKNNSENEEIIKSDEAAFENTEKESMQEIETEEAEGISEEEEYVPLSRRILKEIVSWILCIVIAFGAAMVIRTWVFTVVKVDGPSMNPTLQHNQRLFTQILGYTPERGDVIIFHPKSHPDIAYVKRIIATEGDRIWIDEQSGAVHLKKNGSDTWEILDEDYILETSYFAGIAQKYADSSGEGLLIEKDHVFVMGDNRNNSSDSREPSVGNIKREDIIGRAWLRIWPFDKFGILKHQ